MDLQEWKFQKPEIQALVMLFPAIDLTALSFTADKGCQVSTMTTIESVTLHLSYCAITIFVVVVSIMFIAQYMELSEKSIKEEVQAGKLWTDNTAADRLNVTYFDVGADAEFSSCIDASKCDLLSIIGLSISKKPEEEKSSNLPWSLVPFGSNSDLFTCRSDFDGIFLRTSILVKRSAKAVLSWLMSQNITTGLEGVSERYSTIIKSHQGGSITLRRLCFKGSITSARMDFIIITSISILHDGTYVIASRSINATESSSLSRKKSKNGYIRGIIYASGFVLRPVESSDGEGCKISLGVHLDMLGSNLSASSSSNSCLNPSSESRASENASKLDNLAISVVNLMDRIHMISVNEADSGDDRMGGNFDNSNIIIPILRETIDSSYSLDESARSSSTTASYLSQNSTSLPASLRNILSDPPNINSRNDTINNQNNHDIISNTRINFDINDISPLFIGFTSSSVLSDNSQHFSIQNPDTLNNVNMIPNNRNVVPNILNMMPKIGKKKIDEHLINNKDSNMFNNCTEIQTVKKRNCQLDNQLVGNPRSIKLNVNQIHNLRIASQNVLVKSKEFCKCLTKFLDNTKKIDLEKERRTSIDQEITLKKGTFREKGTLLGLGSPWRLSSSLKQSSVCSSPSKPKERDGLLKSMETSCSSSPRNPVHNESNVSTDSRMNRDRDITDTARLSDFNGTWELISEENGVRIYELASTCATGTSLYIAQCNVQVRLD